MTRDAATTSAADIAARTDSYFNRTKTIVARFGDKRVTYAVFLRRPVICAPRLMLDWLTTVAERARHRVRRRPDLPGRRLGRRRRADRLPHRQHGASVRPGNDPAAEDRPGLRRRAQRLSDVPGAAGRRVPGDGGAPLRRRRDAGHDGLRRLRRQRGGEAGRARRASSATPTTAPRTGSARRAASAPCRTR